MTREYYSGVHEGRADGTRKAGCLTSIRRVGLILLIRILRAMLLLMVVQDSRFLICNTGDVRSLLGAPLAVDHQAFVGSLMSLPVISYAWSLCQGGFYLWFCGTAILTNGAPSHAHQSKLLPSRASMTFQQRLVYMFSVPLYWWHHDRLGPYRRAHCLFPRIFCATPSPSSEYRPYVAD